VDFVGPARFTLETFDTKGKITMVPDVERVSGDAKVPTGRGDFMRDLLVMLDPPQALACARIGQKFVIHTFGCY
jgi:hypothetical protein